MRLKPLGLHMKVKIDAPKWFLEDRNDVRSSLALEDAGSEFVVQGLELDWAGVCWDADLRFEDGNWQHYRFRGTSWTSVHSPRNKAYLSNAYRVLLTRARQGLVIFVPRGAQQDQTRDPRFYDETFHFLLECGFDQLGN